MELKAINESSANDSAIISIITILSAIYVPGSFVAVSPSDYSLTILDVFFFSFLPTSPVNLRHKLLPVRRRNEPHCHYWGLLEVHHLLGSIDDNDCGPLFPDLYAKPKGPAIRSGSRFQLIVEGVGESLKLSSQ